MAEKTSTSGIILVVIEDSKEMPVALYYAARRALHTSMRLGLLYVIDNRNFVGMRNIEELMRAEAQQEAKKLVGTVVAEVKSHTGIDPIAFIREGSRKEELLKLLQEEPSISLLVAGAPTEGQATGSAIPEFLAQIAGHYLRIPVTIVPGDLSHDELNAIS